MKTIEVRDARQHPAPSALATSGLVELAAGALSGWVFAAVKYEINGSRALGIKNAARIRQWHLDLAALGAATIATAVAVPNAPRPVQWALGVGAWSNAMMFLPLAYWPEALQNPTYRKVGMASFVSTSVGFAGMAATAVIRRRASLR